MTRTFKTSLIWHDSRGSECEAEVQVTYVGHKGFAGDLTDPPQGATVEITKIVDIANPSDPIPDRFFEDEDLLQECFEDWESDEIEAAEWREQSRRDRMMEGF